jgi:iron-sulfur cluster assembly protein
MAVMITEKAALEVKRVISEQKLPEETVLRIGLKGGGCAGYDYVLGFDASVDAAKDFVTEQFGIKVAVDKKSDLHLDGTVVDFRDELNRRGFAFNNPNATRTCGCGSSFSA